MNIPQRASVVAATVIAFIGLWLLFVPFYGAPGSQRGNRTLDALAYGERGLCRPAFVGVTSASLSDDARDIDCQKVGVDRWERGWMVLWTAGVAAGTGMWFLRDRSPGARHPLVDRLRAMSG